MPLRHLPLRRFTGRTGFGLALALALLFGRGAPLWSQDSAGPPPDDGGPSADAALAPTAADAAVGPPAPSPAPSAASQDSSINALELFFQGGIFMYPITFLCFLGVTFALERWLGLRRAKVIPNRLVTALGQLAGTKGAFDPRQAYRLCQQYPSAASNVIRTMLLKVGRPHAEVEQTVKEASEREAERLYRNVRWLDLCASIAPLLGLLGTIQGMIIAFHDTTLLAPGANKATELAHGIYVALVTTFAGLIVAIPAATVSHFFEGRIQALFLEIEELLSTLLPHVERYEGRVRFGRQSTDGDRESGKESTPLKDSLAGTKS